MTCILLLMMLQECVLNSIHDLLLERLQQLLQSTFFTSASIVQKRPTLVQKRPTTVQKRPTTVQKRPTTVQKRPAARAPAAAAARYVPSPQLLSADRAALAIPSTACMCAGVER